MNIDLLDSFHFVQYRLKTEKLKELKCARVYGLLVSVIACKISSRYLWFRAKKMMQTKKSHIDDKNVTCNCRIFSLKTIKQISARALNGDLKISEKFWTASKMHTEK